jgi:hypothetical protein
MNTSTWYYMKQFMKMDVVLSKIDSEKAYDKVKWDFFCNKR